MEGGPNVDVTMEEAEAKAANDTSSSSSSSSSTDDDSSSSSSSGDDDDKSDFYRKAVGLFDIEVEVDGWRGYVMDAFSEKNPLNMAILHWEDLSTIQSLYESDPTKLSPHTIEMACIYGARPGVIPYLANENPEIIGDDSLHLIAWRAHKNGPRNACHPGDISTLARLNPKTVSFRFLKSNDDEEEEEEDDDDDDNNKPISYPISMLMENRAPESDIKILVELWPECVIIPMKFGSSWISEEASTPLGKCIKKGYSTDLRDFMIQCIPDKINDFKPNNMQIGLNDIVWIERVFHNFQGKFDFKQMRWEGPGFGSFLGICCFKHQRINELSIKLPPNIRNGRRDRSGRENLLMQEFKEAYSLQKHKDHPTTTKLTLKFSDQSYCELLDLLPKWPRLQDLALYVGDHLEPSMTAICTLIKKGRLKRLRIKSKKSATKCSRKRNASSEVVKSPFQPLFDALETNETIASLEIYPIKTRDVTPCCELLLDTLKKNKTLIQVEKLIHYVPVLSSSKKQLAHYLELNRCGRKMAQDDSTTLEAFVSLLASVIAERLQGRTWYQRRGYRIDSCDGVSILYRLLREGINKWS